MDSNSEAPTDRETLREQVALFRHSLVAPLASEQLERGEIKLALQDLARRRHVIPGSQRTRVGQSTLRRWLTLFRSGGFEALKPGLRKDFGASRAIPEYWVGKAIALRREVPSRSARVLVEALERLPGYPEKGINVHTMDQVLRRRGLRRQKPGHVKVRRRRTRRWTARHVNAIWQGDATPGIWLPDPRNPEGDKIKTVLFLWIDDVSRLVPYAEFFLDETLPRMERTLKLAVLRRGLPGALYTDNGNVYRATQFLAALAELRVKAIKSQKAYPQGRGKIERIFGVIQQDLYPEIYEAIKAGSVRTLADLNEALWAWLERIYHRRIHSETKKTPLDAYRQGLDHVRPADPVKVGRAFLWRYTRKVSKNGFLSLLGNKYSVDLAWAGQKLELRLDPFDFSRVDVYRDARPVARAQVRDLKRSSSRALDLEPLKPPEKEEPSGVSFLDTLRQEYRRQQAAELGEIAFRDALDHPNPKENA